MCHLRRGGNQILDEVVSFLDVIYKCKVERVSPWNRAGLLRHLTTKTSAGQPRLQCDKRETTNNSYVLLSLVTKSVKISSIVNYWRRDGNAAACMNPRRVVIYLRKVKYDNSKKPQRGYSGFYFSFLRSSDILGFSLNKVEKYPFAEKLVQVQTALFCPLEVKPKTCS